MFIKDWRFYSAAWLSIHSASFFCNSSSSNDRFQIEGEIDPQAVKLYGLFCPSINDPPVPLTAKLLREQNVQLSTLPSFAQFYCNDRLRNFVVSLGSIVSTIANVSTGSPHPAAAV